jgi:hippurate hydrolase
MAIINSIAQNIDDMTAWRRDIHAHPETAFEEVRTAEVVARKLESWGIEVHRGLATTGVIGTLTGTRDNGRAIGLRADLDALDMEEKNDFAHRSTITGKMHGCGHDGHTSMLLGAAKYLAETRNFDGTVHFIFQPAEENEGGGRVMVEEGLFEKFPVDGVYGLHNTPGLPVGKIAMRAGPAMAAFDIFEIVITGRGTHGAMPHLGNDPVVIAAQVVTALQTIVSRATDPLEGAVVSVTQIHAGDTWNVIPDDVVIRGTARSFKQEIHDRLEPQIRRITEGVCAAFGARMTLRYERRYPAVVNTDAETDLASRVAARVVGEENVDPSAAPKMASEDFAFMLNARPGCYIWLGNGGDGELGGCAVHNPYYDFNDNILALGASYWATLVETALPKNG